MKSRKATICAVLFGALGGLLFFCGAAAAQEPAPTGVFAYITPRTAYGAMLGLIGVLIQMWLRAAWPSGRLNEGRPLVLDPSSFVLAVIAAIAAGIAVAIAFDGDISAAIAAAKKHVTDAQEAANAAAADAATFPTDPAKGKAADVAKVAAADAKSAVGTVIATIRLRYGLAIVAFGYIAADLGATGLEKIWAGLQLIVAPIQAIWKRLTGSK